MFRLMVELVFLCLILFISKLSKRYGLFALIPRSTIYHIYVTANNYQPILLLYFSKRMNACLFSLFVDFNYISADHIRPNTGTEAEAAVTHTVALPFN